MSALKEDPLIETLRTEFQDEDYRYAYDEEFSNSRMATQIKVIREQRELKQSQLAELAGMKQSRISALEDVNYNSWSVSTLRRLARALGVRFFFGFESWGELLPEIEGFGRKGLMKPKFENDPAFKGEAAQADTPAPIEKEAARAGSIYALIHGQGGEAQRQQMLPLAPIVVVSRRKEEQDSPDVASKAVLQSLARATDRTTQEKIGEGVYGDIIGSTGKGRRAPAA